MSSPWPGVLPRTESRWWQLPTLVRSFLTIGSSLLLLPLLIAWVLGGGYEWLVAGIAISGVTLFFLTEQRHRARAQDQRLPDVFIP